MFGCVCQPSMNEHDDDDDGDGDGDDGVSALCNTRCY